MLCYWSCDETQLFWFCLNHWDLENHMNKLQPNNSENWINDMKSISKYCTLSFASRNSLTNFQQLSSQQCRVSFCSEGNRSCSLPGKNGGAFGTWSSGSLALNWPWEVGGHLLPTGTETFAVGTSQRWPWSRAGFECRLWLCCCPLSGQGAAVPCWSPMVRATVFPSLTLLGTDPGLAGLRPCWNLCKSFQQGCRNILMGTVVHRHERNGLQDKVTASS